METKGIPRVGGSSGARLRRGYARRSAVAALLTVALAGVALMAGPAVSADVVTVDSDTMRTGWDSSESALSPAAVASTGFGALFSAAVDGQVYAQPLVVGNTVVVATENNAVYGLDAGTGAVQWTRTVGPAWPSATVSCADLAPNVGITATPVFDPATNSVFFTAKTNDGASAQLPHWYMHSLDVTTGAERAGFPVLIGGAPSNDPTHPFNAMTAMQRPGLLLMGGVVYAGFASHCDTAPFVGYVVGVSTAGRQTTMWATETGVSNAEGGIWQSGGGLVSDGPGRILFATGNGIAPPPGPGTSPPSTLAESVVRLQLGADGNLTAQDFFSPAANVKLNQNDADLGAGGPMAVPDGYGTTAHPHLLVQSGKDGHVYLLDRDALGGMAQGPGGTDAVLDTAGPFNGVWGRPAFLGTPQGGYVYQVENAGYLRAFELTPTSTGGVKLSSVGTSGGTFGFSSGSPIVTSSGTDPSTALVWVVYTDNVTGANGQLRAYRAIPDGTGTLEQVFSAPIGTAAKFVSVATNAGMVYVGTRDGHVLAFGSPTTAAVGTASGDLGQVAVGASGTTTLTVTATRAVTVNSITSAAPFGIGASATFPQTLATGASLAVPVTFSPTATGESDGTLTVKTADGETDLLGVHGTGTKDGLGATPSAVTFTAVPTGSASSKTVNIVNTGTTAVTITGVTLPSDPALAVDPATVPSVGATIQPLASVPVSIRFTPTAAGSLSDALTVGSSLGGVTVPITATAISGAAHLTVPASLDFGNVPVGASSTSSFQIQNTGNIPMTITKAKAPLGVFSTTTPVSEGLTIPPGDSVFQSVTFAPTAVGQAGSATSYYLITADDGSGAQEVMLTGYGVNDPVAAYAQKIGAGTASSPLGQVVSAEYVVGPGTCQDYTRGIICWSPTTGAHEVNGAIYTRYAAAGGPSGFLGFPVTDELATPDGIGRYNHFNGTGGSSIYWTRTTGAHSVQGAIRAAWSASGREQGPLGYPVTDELGTADGVGRYNHFSKAGSIYWTPATGAHSVRGGIRAEWAASGWESGPLGYPTTDELGTPDGIGRYNHFSKAASIYWTPRTGAHSVLGAIRATWAAMGWERSRLGYPASDEFSVPVGRRENFQNGSLTWNSTTGRVAVG
ncbi:MULTISPECIES: choice-of-anchor D domain-containing protein [Arthrobacter]|uniref:Choice-of-anchor D domain-containing protein n=2 Tax=Arthrobacter TaxID=1663 RepID=A0ABU9KN03_9MICC|nr:choice-of-anchor D domain-containing protein [Arthrobacter sp. YJM1]MDP5226843.1 choice-of-anchor D domain-containing protein [Arthrobacter sp. YJM1]